MSFSKSRVKRFNDIPTDACAPPVGTYDPKLPDSIQSSVQFSASPVERLKDFTDASFSTSSSILRFPASELVNRKMPGQLTKSNSFKNSPAGAIKFQGSAKTQHYEQEIKRLLMERSALLKQLASKDKEGEKIYSRMQAAIRERSFFQASVATFEKENKELRRINEIYKIKFETFEGSYKKKDVNMELANVRAQLAIKNHQISDLRLEIMCTREELEVSIMKLCDKRKDITKISSLMIDAMEILKGELSRAKNHIVKMQITEECAEEFYECISAQLQNLDEQMANYQSSLHEIIQEKEMLDVNFNLQNKGTPENLLNEKMANDDQISDDLSSSQPEEQDSQRYDIERVMSSTLDNELQKLPTAESYFEYLEECRAEEKKMLKEELNLQLDKESSHLKVDSLPKAEQQGMEILENELSSEIQLLRNECEKLKHELDLSKESSMSREASLKDQMTKSIEKCELKTTEIEELNKVISALSTQLANLNATLKEETQKTALQIVLSEEKSKKISNLEVLLQTSKDRESSLENELATQVSKFNSVREEMSGKLKANVETLINLKNEINTRETKVNYLKERESLFLGQIDLLTEKGNISEQLVQRLTQQNADLMEAGEAQEALSHKTKMALNSCQVNIAEYQKKVEEHELLIDELKNKIEIEVQQREDVSRELAAQKEISSGLLSDYEGCQLMNGQLKEETNLLKDELQSTSHELFSLRKELFSEIEKGDELAKALDKKEVHVQELLIKLEEAFGKRDQDVVGNQEVEELRMELLSWRTRCDELQAKIAPFQEQLDSYAIDRQMLMSKNIETMSDLKALSLQYAKSLGHQNRKQKIHYMFNLKEENFNLKEANGRLWADILKLRNSLKRDGPKTSIPSGRIGSSSSTPRSVHAPVNKENKDSGTNTPLRDCSNNDM